MSEAPLTQLPAAGAEEEDTHQPPCVTGGKSGGSEASPSLPHPTRGWGGQSEARAELVPLCLRILLLAVEPEGHQGLCRERDQGLHESLSRHQVWGEVIGPHHAGPRGQLMGLCHLLQVRWKSQEECKPIWLSKGFSCYEESLCTLAKAWRRGSCDYLAFCSRSLSGVLFLHSLENTVTRLGIRGHPPSWVV